MRYKTPEKQEIYDTVSHPPLPDAQPVPEQWEAPPDQLTPAVTARAVVCMCEQYLLKRIADKKKNGVYCVGKYLVNIKKNHFQDS